MRTHDAVFDGSNELFLMVNVVNLGQRPITLTHVWFDVMPPLHVLNEARPLPKMLQPDEPWETWVRLSDFGSRLMSLDERQLRRSARVRISTGHTIKARPTRRPRSRNCPRCRAMTAGRRPSGIGSDPNRISREWALRHWCPEAGSLGSFPWRESR